MRRPKNSFCALPGRELANSMPVPCATLDQVQCQRLDPVPCKTQDQFGPILGIGPTSFSYPVPCGTLDQFGPIFDIGPTTFSDDLTQSSHMLKLKLLAVWKLFSPNKTNKHLKIKQSHMGHRTNFVTFRFVSTLHSHKCQFYLTIFIFY